MITIADRISGIVCLGIGAFFHVSDQYVHVIGNEIINAGYNATGHGGSWRLLNALMFDRSKAWMMIFFSLAIIFLTKSTITEIRGYKKRISNKIPH